MEPIANESRNVLAVWGSPYMMTRFSIWYSRLVTRCLPTVSQIILRVPRLTLVVEPNASVAHWNVVDAFSSTAVGALMFAMAGASPISVLPAVYFAAGA